MMIQTDGPASRDGREPDTSKPASQHKRVIVLGGGFAGQQALRILARKGHRIERVLIDRRRTGEFAPLYPDLISGRVSARSLTVPLDDYARAKGAHFVRASVKDIQAGRVETDRGLFQADAILLATGCVTNWYGNGSARQHAFGLKSNLEGLRLGREIQRRYVEARDEGRPCRVLIVGGGYTGFEAAGHAHLLLSRLQRRDRWARDLPIEIRILDIAPRVLSMIDDDLAGPAVRLIESMGVDVQTGLTVESIAADRRAVLSDGSEVDNALVVWTAGVTPGAEAANLDVEKRAQGRLGVDQYLRLPGQETLFAAGDVAGALGNDGQPLRMGVQFSIAAGSAAARNIVAALAGRKCKAFRPLDPGYVVPLARTSGAGDILRLRKYHGPLPFFLHYFMCIARNWTVKKRLFLLADLLGLHLTERYRRRRG
ncbi:MAG: NAD(P)/FAD-dependent oxidoreductase [Planctomycetota bacterium]